MRLPRERILQQPAELSGGTHGHGLQRNGASSMSESTELATSRFTRRRFFRWTSSLAASIGAAPLFSPARSLASPVTEVDGEDYYDKLGVPKIINAAGTYTTLSAACMPSVVVAAVQKAALHPVC